MRSLDTVPEPVAGRLREAACLSQAAYVANDPVQLAHRYADRGDREVVALAAALLAFGRVRAFLPKIEAFLEVLGVSPRRHVLDYRPSRDARFFDGFRSRIYTGDDLRLLLVHLREVLREHGTLEDAFLAAPRNGDEGRSPHLARLTAFSRLFRRLDPRPLTGASDYPPGYRHLVSDPALGGAAKRWNLFLRWVVRPADGVDLGLWKRVDAADLIIPLDTHVGRISSLIGLRKRRALDWKAAEEVTARLRAIDPEDPVRFDFPLSHIGISEKCRGRWVRDVCTACRIAGICRVGKRHVRKSPEKGGAA